MAADHDPRGPTWTESHRRQCEARHVARLDPQRRKLYLARVKERRGDLAYWILFDDLGKLEESDER